MAEKTQISISPIFFNIMGSLASTSMGQTWNMSRSNGKIYARKMDEEVGTILLNMEFDDFSLKFEEESITFHNIKDFLSSLKIQDYPNSDVTLTRQVFKGYDTILIKAGKSNIYHRLSSKDRYADRYGFDDVIDVDEMDADVDFPKMLSFSMSSEAIKTIYAKASKFKSEFISFTKNTDGIVVNFTSNSDKVSEYCFDLSPDEVDDFENCTISPETLFPYSIFHLIRSINSDIKLFVFGERTGAVLAFKGEFLSGNVNVKFNASVPSRL